MLGRIATAAAGPLRRLAREGDQVKGLASRRAALAADRDLRARRLEQMDRAAQRARDPSKLAGPVAEAASAYCRAVDAADVASDHLRVVLDAFDLALKAEEAAAVRAVAGARLAHAERAAGTLGTVVATWTGGGERDASEHFARLLARFGAERPVAFERNPNGPVEIRRLFGAVAGSW